jgi:hypothetical protein
MSQYDRMLSTELRSKIGQACDLIQKTIQSVFMPSMGILEALYGALQAGIDLQCSEGDFISSEQVLTWLDLAKTAVQAAQEYIPTTEVTDTSAA